MSTRFTRADVDLINARRHPTPPGHGQGVARERDLHAAILGFCRQQGWAVVHSRMDRPATSGIGTPDFVIGLPGGRTLWIEAKSGSKKPTPEQRAWLAMLRRLGHQAVIVRNLDEFLAALAVPGTSPAPSLSPVPHGGGI